MSVVAGSTSRNPAIFTGIAGAMLGLLFGIAITILVAGAVERGTSATGGGAALAQARVFEALHVDRGYGNAAPAQVFNALHLERGTSATGGGAALAQAQVFNALHLDRGYGNAATAQVFNALHLDRGYGNAAPAKVFNALHLERE